MLDDRIDWINRLMGRQGEFKNALRVAIKLDAHFIYNISKLISHKWAFNLYCIIEGQYNIFSVCSKWNEEFRGNCVKNGRIWHTPQSILIVIVILLLFFLIVVHSLAWHCWPGVEYIVPFDPFNPLLFLWVWHMCEECLDDELEGWREVPERTGNNERPV